MFPGKPYTWVRNGIDTARFAFDAATRERLRHELGFADHTGYRILRRFATAEESVVSVEVFERYHAINPDSALILVEGGHFTR